MAPRVIGETIKDFKLIRRLGGGAMGEVWAASLPADDGITD